jgi:integration host factor subunit alpha
MFNNCQAIKFLDKKAPDWHETIILAFISTQAKRAAVMTLTKESLVSALQNQNVMSKKDASHIVDTLLETIKNTLASGEDVLISGFGKFEVKDKNARRGRNPATGGPLLLRNRRVVTFKLSGRLRERINEG